MPAAFTRAPALHGQRQSVMVRPTPSARTIGRLATITSSDTSTAGFTGISVSWDQTGSATGPRDFKLAYSTDGTNFTDFYSYSLPSPAVSWSSGSTSLTTKFSSDLSSVTALDNQANVYFRHHRHQHDIHKRRNRGNRWNRPGGQLHGQRYSDPCSDQSNRRGRGSSDSLLAGASTLLTVAVTPGTNPASTSLAVACDLTAIGGSASQSLFDDGSNGDVTAGDNIFPIQATVAGATSLGAKSLPCTITDAQARSGSAIIDLTIVLPSTNPTGVRHSCSECPFGGRIHPADCGRHAGDQSGQHRPGSGVRPDRHRWPSHPNPL